METRRPLIVDVKRASLEDGPGIRSVVFFKGCPLRCVFCHNPEAQEAGPEIAFCEERCIRCGECVLACRRSAIDLASPSRIDRSKCDRCGDCALACPGRALRLIGAYWPAEKLVELLLRDAPFYRHSGGGVTLSGGECTMYPDYLQHLLELLKGHHIHVVLETAGWFDYEVFRERILPYVDLIYFDVKFADPLLHLEHTGYPNDRIVHNLERLLTEPNVEVQPRVPLVPGMTATDENLRSIGRLLREVGAETASFLPYNPLAVDMWGKLGKRQPLLPSSFMPIEEEKVTFTRFRTLLQVSEM